MQPSRLAQRRAAPHRTGTGTNLGLVLGHQVLVTILRDRLGTVGGRTAPGVVALRGKPHLGGKLQIARRRSELWLPLKGGRGSRLVLDLPEVAVLRPLQVVVLMVAGRTAAATGSLGRARVAG